MTQLVTEFYDLNMLFEQVGKEETSLQRFVEIFLNTVPADMETLKSSIANNDFNRVRSSAHKMKSSYMLMGAEWAKELCFKMETIAKAEQETEKLPELFGELLSNFNKMVKLLRS